jgi:branched-chain amino acid transport system ATP-binding protein
VSGELEIAPQTNAQAPPDNSVTSPASPAIGAGGLRKRFGALEVTRGVDLSLQPGARHALIGPNGAGKTTLVNLLAGALAPDEGTVHLLGQDITEFSQAERVRAGLVRTFQISELFKSLTVLENIALARAQRLGLATRWWRPLGHYPDVVEQSMDVLERLALADDAARPVVELAYGRQRLVEIAIALALEPRVLLLDEPAAGVPAQDTERILGAMDTLSDDIAVLIIEHDMNIVFRFASEITVLVEGEVLMTGGPEEVARDEAVRRVYLGQSA